MKKPCDFKTFYAELWAALPIPENRQNILAEIGHQEADELFWKVFSWREKYKNLWEDNRKKLCTIFSSPPVAEELLMNEKIKKDERIMDIVQQIKHDLKTIFLLDRDSSSPNLDITWYKNPELTRMSLFAHYLLRFACDLKEYGEAWIPSAVGNELKMNIAHDLGEFWDWGQKEFFEKIADELQEELSNLRLGEPDLYKNFADKNLLQKLLQNYSENYMHIQSMLLRELPTFTPSDYTILHRNVLDDVIENHQTDFLYLEWYKKMTSSGTLEKCIDVDLKSILKNYHRDDNELNESISEYLWWYADYLKGIKSIKRNIEKLKESVSTATTDDMRQKFEHLLEKEEIAETMLKNTKETKQSAVSLKINPHVDWLLSKNDWKITDILPTYKNYSSKYIKDAWSFSTSLVVHNLYSDLQPQYEKFFKDRFVIKKQDERDMLPAFSYLLRSSAMNFQDGTLDALGCFKGQYNAYFVLLCWEIAVVFHDIHQVESLVMAGKDTWKINHSLVGTTSLPPLQEIVQGFYKMIDQKWLSLYKYILRKLPTTTRTQLIKAIKNEKKQQLEKNEERAKENDAPLLPS